MNMATSSPETLQEILDSPALQAPVGAAYNFVDPSNINAACWIILAVSMFVVLIAVSIRLYTTGTILRSFNWEDGALVLGTAFYIAYTAIAVKTVFEGAGIHQGNIHVRQFEKLLYWINIDYIIYDLSFPFIRISIALQYLRFFNPSKTITFMHISCWATIVAVGVFYLAATFGTIFECTPRGKIWNPLREGHCLNIDALTICTGAFNVLIDIILVLLPQFEIWNLQLSFRQKAGVSGVFLTALIACAACIIRLYYSVKLTQTGDVSYYVGLVGIYSAAEASIGILCTCLPVFPRFFRVVGPKLASFYKSSTGIGTRLKTSTTERPARNIGPVKCESTWIDSRSPQSHLQGTYEALDDGHESIAMGTTELGEFPEYELHGLRGIQVIRTYGIESSPALSEDVDLEGQKRIQRIQMSE